MSTSDDLKEMSGIRINYYGMDEPLTEKVFHAHFANPDNGGGKISSIHYPMFGGDAVIIFEELHTAEEVEKYKHQINGKKVFVSILPQIQVFRKLQAEVDPAVTAYLQATDSIRDEIIHHGNIEYFYDEKTHISYMTGTWYQLEWAWKLIDDIMHQQNKALKASAVRKRVEDEVYGTRSIKASNKAEIGNSASYQLTKGTTRIPGDTFPVTISIPVEEHMDAEVGSVTIGPVAENMKNISFADNSEKKVNDEQSWSQRTLSKQQTPGVSETETRISRSLSVEDKDARDLESIEFSHQGLKISLHTGDITLSETQAIVNVGMNSQMGVCLAVTTAAGPSLALEMKNYFAEHGKLETGEVMCTSAGGRLHQNVTCVLHTVGPLWTEDLPKDIGAYQLMKTFLNCLICANKMKLTSMVFPAISTGTFMGSVEVCAKCFLDAVLLFTYENKGKQSLKEVHLVNEHEDNTANMVIVLRQLLKKGLDLLTVEALEEIEEINKKKKKNPGIFAQVKAKLSDFLSSPVKAVSAMGPTSGISGTQRRAVTVRAPTNIGPVPKTSVQSKVRSTRI